MTFYAGVFAISGLLMGLQLLHARIFSVTTWYYLSFLVISVAMFGLTLGALSVHRGNEQRQRTEFREQIAQALFNMGLSIVVALIPQLVVPVVTEHALWTLVTLPTVMLFTIRPYYFAGRALTLALTRTPYPPARSYGFDLLGAAAGCLFALVLMETIDTPSAIVVVAGAALFASRVFAAGKGRHAVPMGLVLCAAAAVNTLAPKPLFYPVVVKNALVKQTDLALDTWNSISRVTVSNEERDGVPFIWGPSPTLPASLRSTYYVLRIDGDAGSPLTKFDGDCSRGLEALDYDVTTIAYSLPDLRKAGIIGVGGGRDVLSACRAGIRDIIAMDVNAVQISLLQSREPFKSYTRIAGLPGVTLIHSEARSWFARHPERFDVIQMSLIDTWASTNAGGFALSENALYTLEAWRMFLDHLTPAGVMTVSRWYLRDAHSEVERLMSLAISALLAHGVAEPARHLFLASSGSIATLVISGTPLTEDQLDALTARAAAMQFNVLLSPRQALSGDDLGRLLQVKTRASLDQVARDSQFDLSPPTDERPYFFNQVRLTRPASVLRLVLENSRTAMLGHARAILNLYIIIVLSLVMVAGTILWPLRKEVATTGWTLVAGGTIWFLLIGIGFMLLEISLLQRLSMYLGHPAYGLGVVLFSLALSTGVGSLLCDRFPLRSKRARVTWIVITACAAVAAIDAISIVTTRFADATLLLRALLCVSVTFPLGCLLGFGFPTGMALASTSSRSTAWFWGINGAAGVMAGAVGLALNMAFGIDRTMLVGALCYLALLIPTLWQSGD